MALEFFPPFKDYPELEDEEEEDESCSTNGVSSSNVESSLPPKKGRKNIKFHRRFKTMDRKGSLMSLPMNLLILFIAVTFFVALIPGFSEILGMAQNSQSLNCVGYVYNGDPGNVLSYNATIGTQSSIACLAIKLYLPYIALGVLIAGVAMIFYGRSSAGGQEQMYG